MLKLVAPLILLSCGLESLQAADIQGLIVDWNCAKPMVKNGPEKTLKQNKKCSLMKNYKRQAYGLITDDEKFYKLQDPGNRHVLELLKNTPTKDDLRVIVHGDLQGNTITVNDMSIL